MYCLAKSTDSEIRLPGFKSQVDRLPQSQWLGQVAKSFLALLSSPSVLHNDRAKFCLSSNVLFASPKQLNNRILQLSSWRFFDTSIEKVRHVHSWFYRREKIRAVTQNLKIMLLQTIWIAVKARTQLSVCEIRKQRFTVTVQNKICGCLLAFLFQTF